MYAKWKGAYQDMLVENADLREHILHQQEEITQKQSGIEKPVTAQFDLIPAQVVNNSIIYTKNYLTINISLLHTDIQISAKLTSLGVMGTVCWLGDNPRQVNLLYIPRHLTIQVGDPVVTSGYSTTFYEGVIIGKVSHVKLNKAAMFYEIWVELSTDLSALQHVYVIKNHLSKEQNSLEQTTRAYYE
jgi:rod shape-determining protein MreC